MGVMAVRRVAVVINKNLYIFSVWCYLIKCLVGGGIFRY